MQTDYDYIILGAGLSGLTMSLKMARDPFFKEKTIAIMDQDLNKGNDRTWCFWEIENNLFEKTVSYTWEQILVKGNGLSEPMNIQPYSYKKIEGADLYAFAKEELSTYSNITFIEANVKDILEEGGKISVLTEEHIFSASRVLNSIYKPHILNGQSQEVVLQQHFIGWEVATKEPVFNKDVATYMDFSISQEGNCRFMYVLPTAPNKALLEYTLFSERLLPKAEYEQAIKDYLDNLGVTDYKITATEQGSIPMTCYNFTQHNTKNVVHIGTAGGWTKASTGYTFRHTLKKSAILLEYLKSKRSFTDYSIKNRWTFYDKVLLEVLSSHNERGAEIFTEMFKNVPPQTMFRFLDEESTFWEELKVIWSAPKFIFMKAAFKVIFK